MATSTTTLGLRKPATTDTVDVSTDLNTPYDTIDDQFQKGSDVASATSITVPDEGYFDITGTTTTAGFSTVNAGIMKMVQFDGVLQLTHNSTSFNLPTGANITTAAGDRALFRSEGSGNWRCMWYQRASGAALAIADNSVDSDAYVDGSIDTAHVADNQITLAKLSDGTQGGVLYYGASGAPTELSAGTDGYVLATNGSSANPAWEQVTGTGIANDAIDSQHYADTSIDTGHIADNQVTLAKLSDGTQGGILYYGSGGAPTELSAGTSGYYLKTQGASANPVWAAVATGGGKIDQVSFTAGASGSTTSTSYVDVSGGEVDITTDKGGLMAWYFLSGYNNTLSANTYIALQLDSATEVAQSQVTQHASNQDYVYSGFYSWSSVSDAAHEINIRMKVSSGTFTLRGGAILVMEWDD